MAMEFPGDYTVTVPFDWAGLTETDLCPTGHTVGTSNGDGPVEYLDGQIVGYCQRCRCRIVFPKVKGGIAASWVNAIAVQILGGEFNADLWADFVAASEALVVDKESIEEALGLVDTVREAVLHRLRDE